MGGLNEITNTSELIFTHQVLLSVIMFSQSLVEPTANATEKVGFHP